MHKLESCGRNCYQINRTGSMLAEVQIYLNAFLFQHFEEEQSVQQLVDAASLPGVISPVIGMPDIHTGFGLPIGGVMAMNGEDGLVSAGAVGMDINCGVRLLQTNIQAAELTKNQLIKLISEIESRVPSGIGQTSKHERLIRDNFKQILVNGVTALIELGIGRAEDKMSIEDGGCMAGAVPAFVSEKALNRGVQLSTTGGGNHFIELGYVDQIFCNDSAKIFGLQKDCLTVLIHTGSRGFGHQICTEYTAEMNRAAPYYKLKLPSAGLAAVPISSEEGNRYLGAMACAVNFAFANRQWITDDLRRAFRSYFGGHDRDYGLELIYDVAHNTARFEMIGKRKMLIHRKGATRALPAGHFDNPKRYLNCGHPVLIPGSMGSPSYVIKAEAGVEKIYNSVNHGAGRILSRTAARKKITVDQLKESLGQIVLSGRNYRAYLDEAPQAYKDIEHVIETFSEINLTRKVARLRPLAVIKSEGKE